METTDNNAASSPAPSGTARRSGRVSKLPEKFVPDAHAGSKRKHRGDDDDDAENDAPDTDRDESDAEADDAADDDEIEEPPRRKKKSSQPARSRKPAAKKPKTNGDASAGGDHPVRLASRPKKTARIVAERQDGDELYGK